MSESGSPLLTHPTEVAQDVREDSIPSPQDETAQLKQQLSSYQEQVYQHSMTIVALEEKLVASLTQQSLTPSKEEVIEKRDQYTTTQFLIGTDLTVDVSQLQKPEQKNETETDNAVTAELAINVDTQTRFLRKQLFTLSERLRDSESNLVKSKELNEKFQHALQLKTSVMARQYAELVEMRRYLPQVRSALSTVEEGVASIVANVFSDSNSKTKFSPLIELAVTCTQDGHIQTIEKQAQALITLRVQVTQLEEANRLVPTHREALTEVARVREELRRARLALDGSDISYLVQKKEEKDLRLSEQLDRRTVELEEEREAHQFTKENFHSFDSLIMETVLMLNSKFYNLYRLDFKLVSDMSQKELENERELRKRQFEEFSSKLSEYEGEILSRQPAAEEEKSREIERLRESILGHQSKINQLKEEIFSLSIQKDLLEKEKLYSPKKERIHSCLFTKEMVDNLIQDERKRFSFILKKKEQRNYNTQKDSNKQLFRTTITLNSSNILIFY